MAYWYINPDDYGFPMFFLKQNHGIRVASRRVPATPRKSEPKTDWDQTWPSLALSWA